MAEPAPDELSRLRAEIDRLDDAVVDLLLERIAVVRRSRLSANTSAVDGGGIYAAGSLTVEDSVITGNGGRYGGGISARGAAVNHSRRKGSRTRL